MEALWQQMIQVVGPYLPRLGAGLAVLVCGWLIALMVAAAVKAALRRTTLDNRLATWVAGDDRAAHIDIESWVSRGVYYLLMLFVLVAVFQTLGLTMLTEPLRELLAQLFAFAPRLLGASALLLVAWLVASGLRLVLTRLLRASKFEQRLADKTGEPVGDGSLAKTMGDAVYWFVFLLFLPGILDALALEGMLDPVHQIVNEMTGFLPNLFTAAVTLAVGWFLARVIQRIVTSLLAAIGADALSERVGLEGVLGGQKLSSVLGLVAYVFIFIPILITALSALQLDAITQPLSNMLNMILEAVPTIFAAALVLVISYMVGRVAAGLVTNLLKGVGFNSLPSRLGIGAGTAGDGAPGDGAPGDDAKSPSAVVGSLALIAIMLFAATEAANLLGFSAVSDLMAEFLDFAGHILVGLIIFAIGLFLAKVASGAVSASSTAQAGLLATVTRVSVLALTGAMALRHMGLANEIINLAFGLILGSAAVAVAIAFGLGGRDLAARHMAEWSQSLNSDEKPR